VSNEAVGKLEVGQEVWMRTKVHREHDWKDRIWLEYDEGHSKRFISAQLKDVLPASAPPQVTGEQGTSGVRRLFISS